jgi:hypothetical protein
MDEDLIAPLRLIAEGMVWHSFYTEESYLFDLILMVDGQDMDTLWALNRAWGIQDIVQYRWGILLDALDKKAERSTT